MMSSALIQKKRPNKGLTSCYNKKMGGRWKDRYDIMAKKYSELLIELGEVKKEYRLLEQKYNSLLASTESNE
jgi:hypothetical protein